MSTLENPLQGVIAEDAVPVSIEELSEVEEHTPSYLARREEMTNAAKPLNALDVSAEVIEQLQQRMVGTIEIVPISEATWPPDKETFKQGKHKNFKFNLFPKCKRTLIPRCKKGTYEIGLSREEQRAIENMLGMVTGTLSPHIANNYWQTEGAVHVNDDGLVLDLESPRQFLQYCVLLGCDEVAVSHEKRYERPAAEFIISDPLKEAKIENEKVSLKRKAYKEFNSMTPEAMRNIVMLMGHKVDSMPNDMIENKISEVIESSPQEFLTYITIPNRAERVLLQKLLLKGYVKEFTGSIRYGEHVLGIDKASAAAFLALSKNQDFRIQLEEKVK